MSESLESQEGEGPSREPLWLKRYTSGSMAAFNVLFGANLFACGMPHRGKFLLQLRLAQQNILPETLALDPLHESRRAPIVRP